MVSPMIPAENVSTRVPQARIDLYRLTIGVNRANQPFEVLALYLHAFASYLPVSVIKTILKNEFDPEGLRLLRSCRFATDVNALHRRFLSQVRAADICPLRSEKYEAPPKSVMWHFFVLRDIQGLMEVLKRLNSL